MTCKHLRIRYAEPNGTVSKGRCMDCGRFVPSLPNSIPYKKYRWRIRPDNATKNIGQWPVRKK